VHSDDSGIRMPDEWSNMREGGFIKTDAGLWVPSEDLLKARTAAKEEDEFRNELKGPCAVVTSTARIGTRLNELDHGSAAWAFRKVKGRSLTRKDLERIEDMETDPYKQGILQEMIWKAQQLQIKEDNLALGITRKREDKYERTQDGYPGLNHMAQVYGLRQIFHSSISQFQTETLLRSSRTWCEYEKNRDTLGWEYQVLTFTCARSFFGRLGRQEAVDIAKGALADSLASFDTHRGAAFTTYAWQVMLNALLGTVRKQPRKDGLIMPGVDPDTVVDAPECSDGGDPTCFEALENLEPTVIDHRLERAALEALEVLSETRREALLDFYGGTRGRHLAGKYGVSQECLRTWRHRDLERLRMQVNVPMCKPLVTGRWADC
jgi:DNA-directed RNA polymerase specialized sigma24 family protein